MKKIMLSFAALMVALTMGVSAYAGPGCSSTCDADDASGAPSSSSAKKADAKSTDSETASAEGTDASTTPPALPAAAAK